MNYTEFIENKIISTPDTGIDITGIDIHPKEYLEKMAVLSKVSDKELTRIIRRRKMMRKQGG